MSSFQITVFRARADSYLPRKSHKKSRKGCLACKKRRTKCDEGKPRCARCDQSGANCVYDTQLTLVPGTDRTRVQRVVRSNVSTSLNTVAHTMAVDCVSSNLEDLLQIDESAALALPSASISIVRLLQHFQSVASTTLGDSTVQQIMRFHVAHSAWNQPYVMHMLLAVSSAHLKRLVPASDTLQGRQSYTIAEAKHWENGLSLYQSALASPVVRSNQSVDALISATFLSVIFAFALEDQVPLFAFVEDYDNAIAHALSPMAAGSGIIALGQAIQFHDSVAWMPVLRKGNDRFSTYTNQTPGTDGLPRALVEICDIHENSTPENNEYHSIVRLLTPLLRLERSVGNFVKLIAFGGRTFSLFRPLLQRRDARALLLLSYWFALIRQVDQWWLNDRATSSCLAIVTYLHTISDPGIRALLAFPASCGQADLGYLWE